MKLLGYKFEENTNIFFLFGIKIKIKDRKLERIDNNRSEILNRLFEIEHNMQYEKILKENIKKPLNQYLKDKLDSINNIDKVMTTHNYINDMLKCNPLGIYPGEKLDSAYLCWGTRPGTAVSDTMAFAHRCGKNVMFIEDGFLRSADTNANKSAQEKYRKGISFTIDDLSSYFDATKETRMEQMLNDKNLIITEEQRQRARSCIDKIVETHLTKYNHQPIFEPKIGREGVKKVLVIDQTYGDMSIIKGLGDEDTFKTMLGAAIKENPDADIIVKTHPDTMVGKNAGYFTDLEASGHVYKMTAPINPISLIKYCDKVYVCSTQFGFEALMCGKEVHTFGMPFYACWGLTIDNQKCERRTNTRTIEDIFYIVYILYSYYINPENKCECEIEEAMDYLIKLREEYFVEQKKLKGVL